MSRPCTAFGRGCGGTVEKGICGSCGAAFHCPICVAHPGWAHDDDRAHREPLDVCKACLGSGLDLGLDGIDPRVLLGLAQAYALKGKAALADEAEGDLRLAVARLANVSATLTHLVTTW